MELHDNGTIPPRIIILLSISFLTIGFVAYYSDEPAWKTLVKISAYCLALIFLCAGAFGIKGLIANMTDAPSQLSMSWSAILASFGIASALLIGKYIKSKWLN